MALLTQTAFLGVVGANQNRPDQAQVCRAEEAEVVRQGMPNRSSVVVAMVVECFQPLEKQQQVMQALVVVHEML